MYLVGDKISIADVHLVELLSMLLLLQSEAIQYYPNLWKWKENVVDLLEVRTYYKTHSSEDILFDWLRYNFELILFYCWGKKKICFDSVFEWRQLRFWFICTSYYRNTWQPTSSYNRFFTFQLTLVSSIVVGSNFFSLRSRLFGHTGPQEIYSSLQDLITQQAARNAKNQQVSFTEQTPEVIAENNLRVGVWLFYKKKKKLLQKKN